MREKQQFLVDQHHLRPAPSLRRVTRREVRHTRAAHRLEMRNARRDLDRQAAQLYSGKVHNAWYDGVTPELRLRKGTIHTKADVNAAKAELDLYATLGNTRFLNGREAFDPCLVGEKRLRFTYFTETEAGRSARVQTLANYRPTTAQ